jgi:hypothetical protein
MQIQKAKEIHNLIIDEKWIEAATTILDLLGQRAEIKNKPQALNVCRNLLQFLLDNEMYLHAATLQWGGDMFNAEPEAVRRVFKALHENSKVLFCGASSMGKSYNAGAWMYLDWRRDPLYTSVKCIGISEDQVRKHVFSHIVKLHRACAIPMAETVDIRDSDMWMGVKEAGFEFGITGIAYKQSQETSGAIKGYKSMAVRKHRHPKFGMMSRLRLLGDEGQNWPGGPFKDINTWVSQIDGPEKVKIAIAFNPESISQVAVQMAEPEDGWNAEEIERLYDWFGKSGWRVCRLDAARSENVIQKKVLYPGLQTYEGFLSYLKAGGDTSANYSTFARGWPPMKGGANTIIPPSWPQEARGEATFIENPIVIASVDLAYMGPDSAQMAVGRWGLASGWRDSKGAFHYFTDRLNVAARKPRHVLQIDQIIPLDKTTDTVTMAEQIMGKCNMLRITPENVVIDKTGIGFGTCSHLQKVWGNIFGVGWNEKATEGKILAEDKEGANSQCDGVMSEMWWAFKRWLDPTAKAVLINPIIAPQPIQTQLTTRRYKTGKNGIKVEPKEEYKARNQASPDESDALVMMVHLIRRIGDVLPGLSEQSKSSDEKGSIKFYSVKDMQSIDSDDSISLDGQEKELTDV